MSQGSARRRAGRARHGDAVTLRGWRHQAFGGARAGTLEACSPRLPHALDDDTRAASGRGCAMSAPFRRWSAWRPVVWRIVCRRRGARSVRGSRATRALVSMTGRGLIWRAAARSDTAYEAVGLRARSRRAGPRMLVARSEAARAAARCFIASRWRRGAAAAHQDRYRSLAHPQPGRMRGRRS